MTSGAATVATPGGTHEQLHGNTRTAPVSRFRYVRLPCPVIGHLQRRSSTVRSRYSASMWPGSRPSSATRATPSRRRAMLSRTCSPSLRYTRCARRLFSSCSETVAGAGTPWQGFSRRAGSSSWNTRAGASTCAPWRHATLMGARSSFFRTSFFLCSAHRYRAARPRGARCGIRLPCPLPRGCFR